MTLLEITGRTDTGRWRERNEDSIAWDAGRGFAVLADGMGGHRAGDTASALAVSVAVGRLIGNASDSGAVSEAVSAANRAVHDKSSEPGFEGMGTTLDLLSLGERAVIGHVGDSRVYRWRGSRLEQLTRDHSLVQEMVDSGAMRRGNARTAAARNVVTRAVGLEPSVEVDAFETEHRPGDVFLMCSDGLTGELDEGEIATVLKVTLPDLERAAEALVTEADEAGGRDNISVILLRRP